MTNHAQNARTMENLRARHVENQRDAAFASHLDRLLRRDDAGALVPEALRLSSTQETRGILVIDGPGGGKSSLVDHALRKHSALQQCTYGQPAWLSISVPSPATFKSVGLEILRKTGYSDVGGRKESWNVWEVVRHRPKMLGIAVLWIDEAHDLFCRESATILRAIKSLMQGDGAVIVILSGTEQLAEVIRSDAQVQRRFTVLNLPQMSDAADGEDLRDLIGAYAGKAGLGLDLDSDLCGRLIHGARNKFGRCIEMTLAAIELALDAGSPELTSEHFATVWFRQEACEIGENVFLVGDWRRIDPDAASHNQAYSTRKRAARK